MLRLAQHEGDRRKGRGGREGGRAGGRGSIMDSGSCLPPALDLYVVRFFSTKRKGEGGREGRREGGREGGREGCQ